MIGTLFAAYPATGSFSRSAIKAKAGVRTPLAGWITGICVLVALYALTGAFYWIPNAALSAVRISFIASRFSQTEESLLNSLFVCSTGYHSRCTRSSSLSSNCLLFLEGQPPGGSHLHLSRHCFSICDDRSRNLRE